MQSSIKNIGILLTAMAVGLSLWALAKGDLPRLYSKLVSSNGTSDIAIGKGSPALTQPVTKLTSEQSSQLNTAGSSAAEPTVLSSLEGVLRIEALPPLTASRVDLQELRFQQTQAQSFVQKTSMDSANGQKSIVAVESADNIQLHEQDKQALSLEQRFALAVESTDSLDWQVSDERSADDIQLISQLSESELSELSPITFNSHVYSTDEQRRFVRLNDQQFMEGDYVQEGVELIAIRYDDIVLRVFGVKCRLPALQDWG